MPTNSRCFRLLLGSAISLALTFTSSIVGSAQTVSSVKADEHEFTERFALKSQIRSDLDFPAPSSFWQRPLVDGAQPGYLREARELSHKKSVEHLGVEASKVTGDALIVDDFGADSLDQVALVMAFEEQLGCEISDDLAERIITMGDAVMLSAEFLASGATAKFDRTKPHVNVGTLGQIGDGKTILTSAITKVLAERGQAEFVPYERIYRAPEERARGITVSTAHVEYETEKRHYAHIDSPGQMDYVKNMITGAAQMDGAILVISVGNGPTSQTREQVRLARDVGVAAIVVYLNVEGDEDKELLDIIELEIREMLSSYEFPGDDVPIVRGSAIDALNGTQDDIGEDSITELLEAMDNFIPQPKRPIDHPFLMPIEDVFSISGRGTVVTGRVERGIVKVGDKVEIVGIRDTRETVVTGVEMFRKLLDQGAAGDNIGVLLRDIGREDVERGQVLAKLGSVLPYTRFKALAYILTKEEGGRHTPFFTNYRPQFYFRTTDVTGVVTLPEGTEMVMPGDSTSVEIELIAPIAMDKGLRFAIREGGRTVGAGIVTKIIE